MTVFVPINTWSPIVSFPVFQDIEPSLPIFIPAYLNNLGRINFDENQRFVENRRIIKIENLLK